ncbi:MAG: hypothetical protein ACETWG_03390 [Candidatus Neomarinimicrobiota bacterium]
MILQRKVYLLVALTGLLFMVPRCGDSTSDTIDPDDLIGTWWNITSGVTLTFESETEGQVYEVRDPQGAYSHLLEGSDDLLVRGYWAVTGNSLSLADEIGPVACPSTTDRFVITMNQARTVMTLTHLGDECLLRASVLADHTWQRRADGS